MTKQSQDSLYETKDIEARPLLIFLSGLTIMCLTVFLTVRSMSQGMTESVEQGRAANHPMASQRKPPSAPLLQAHPTLEIEAHRAAEQTALSSFGWIDRQEGIVHMPIEVAKQAYLKRQGATHQGSDR